MQIDGYVQALRDDLVRVAAVGDESTARAAELLAVALESSLGRRLQEALGEAALELNGQLDEGRIEVRFAGKPRSTLTPATTPTTRIPAATRTSAIANQTYPNLLNTP